MRGLDPARRAIFPIQQPVGLGDVIVAGKTQPRRGAIDPTARAFQLQIKSDRRVVQRDQSTLPVTSKSPALLLVGKSDVEAESFEDQLQLLPVRYRRLDFF